MKMDWELRNFLVELPMKYWKICLQDCKYVWNFFNVCSSYNHNEYSERTERIKKKDDKNEFS